jgi:hypothetical protein
MPFVRRAAFANTGSDRKRNPKAPPFGRGASRCLPAVDSGFLPTPRPDAIPNGFMMVENSIDLNHSRKLLTGFPMIVKEMNATIPPKKWPGKLSQDIRSAE